MVYSLLEGSGRLAWKYEGFSDLHIRARVGFPQNGGGRAGVFLGNLFCCLNYDTQRVELYQGSSLLGSYATSFSKTPDAQLHSDPTVYTIEMRKRGNRVRVYSGSSYTLRFTATVSATSGYAGIQADNEIVCDLLRAGDAWAYEPYECFDVVYPGGVRTSFGRIARSGVTWDEEFQIFSVNSDVDEGSTRSEDISLDYDFFHSHLLEISCGNDYTAKVIPRDINVWTARLFLGDADGFSILYYQDVDSLVYSERFEAARKRLAEIAELRQERNAKKTRIRLFMENMNNHQELVQSFDEELWYSTVDYVTVYEDKRLVFTFRDGRQIEITAELWRAA